MRLLKVEAVGFKSFADRVNISFEKDTTGIVGPNGCGKSNITDAVKWVLGEQSAKSLRGGSMDDIIFAGSESRPALNYAEVTLLFDNGSRRLPIDFDQVEITRRLYRGEGTNEYYINKVQCRLKDIHELIMDTGLGKGSLAMISQGSVAKFAESKPEDRRQIFEEAAGVAKYKKRKEDSLRKLERTQENLSRVEDIVSELERQVGPLKRQSEKAKIYVEKSEQLKEIEVALIVKDIDIYLNDKKELEDRIEKQESQKVSAEASLNIKELKAQELRNSSIKIDNEINELQLAVANISNDAQLLESQKMAIDSRREALAMTKDYLDKNDRISNLKSIVNDLQSEILNKKQTMITYKEEILGKNIETDNIKNAIVESKQEIEDRTRESDRLRMRREMISEQLKNNSNLHRGVQELLNNKNAISGLLGIVQNLINVEEKFELALTAALGAQAQSVVVKTGKDAKQAIKFLKDNRAGRATFLPLDTIETTQVREDFAMAAKTVDGFIGFAKDLVTYNQQEAKAIEFALNNTIIATTLDAALQISNLVYKRYRVATLGGEIINAGGSIVGGHIRAVESSAKYEQHLQQIEAELSTNEKSIQLAKTKLGNLEDQKAQNEIYIANRNVELGRLEAILNIQEEKQAVSVSELEQLTGDKFNAEYSKVSSELIEKLNLIIVKRDALRMQSQEKRTQKLQLTKDLEVMDEEITHSRKILKDVTAKVTEDRMAFAKKEWLLEAAIERLNSIYKMTYEFAKENAVLKGDETEARERVSVLRKEIDDLGHVNIDSIEQFAEVNTRYEDLQSQVKELTEARKTILDSIDEMDVHMTEKFAKVFEEVNNSLQETFRRLFGGGSARLEYTDPTNILESGIEVIVQPPGKTISNINLFSGGEKSLIALSVLFAILKVRPVPLCILDEVDAPLDPVNVERFANYLKEFTKDTQFIVITHRSGTMGQCDTIYGVTMQEQGITKMLSVRLDDAIKMAESDN